MQVLFWHSRKKSWTRATGCDSDIELFLPFIYLRWYFPVCLLVCFYFVFFLCPLASLSYSLYPIECIAQCVFLPKRFKVNKLVHFVKKQRSEN